ncbi:MULTISPECIES: thioredoxin family protein [Paenibacillus]|uniref:thioredoxin family protein n=1 Tax=Paenibacillus TaxID=44249 RepID=UPI000896F7CE|nr:MULTISPECIES: thioredoxin family protein [Paenibacillus]MCZ1269299.1 thioredoxin [Paenibacillus tundrae]SEB27595.1 Thioredoxin [Paenibacillus sp. 276b]SLK16320.1 Thioredoxin [Paenibacillus sp. RU5A]SOC74322.1 Thioredoxin [Paenibacillus sp. RU26A]SOC76456.1 Thioredoxin [Paenibacillus sp. RU5M]
MKTSRIWKVYLPLIFLGALIVIIVGIVAKPGGSIMENIAPDVNNNLAKNVINIVDASAYDKQKDKDYLVYFYSDDCHVCNSYKPLLDKYVTKGSALTVYAVDVLDPDAKSVLKNLHVNETPTLIRITKGIESWRALGDLPIELLPHKSTSSHEKL